jgi:hypothetical protein
MSYDLIDDPTYGDELTISTGYAVRNAKGREKQRLQRFQGHWGVFYHGRVLHDGLHIEEVYKVRDWYAEGVPASDPRWQLLTTPGKQPSPNSDHRRKAGV